MRTLIFVIALYFIWRAVKSWMTPSIPPMSSDAGRPVGDIDDVMVQDPYCKVYFPQRNGYYLNDNGNDVYFCSPECRDKFVASQSNEKHS